MSDDRCGTQAGVKAHYRAGEKGCDACRAAERQRSREYRTRKRQITLTMTTAQKVALRELMDAPGWKDRPCKDPEAWDIHRGRGKTARAFVAEQVADRRRQCHACPLIALCRVYYATKPPVTGVLAGRVLKDQDPTA